MSAELLPLTAEEQAACDALVLAFRTVIARAYVAAVRAKLWWPAHGVHH